MTRDEKIALIERSILRVALECTSRKGSPDGMVFSPAHAAKHEATKIVKTIEEADRKAGRSRPVVCNK